MSATANPLQLLYEQDETAWLDEMARLAALGRAAEMDFRNLADYLESMARRDRRAVLKRTIVLLTHLLKWQFQPQRRSGSWKATIREQRRQLKFEFESATLRRFIETKYEEAHQHARLQAADQTGLPLETFPAEPTMDLDALLDRDLDSFD
jgi:hypothetical protein